MTLPTAGAIPVGERGAAADAGGSQLLADRAYERLVHKITRLEAEPGSVLVERDLMQEFGIGRTPIREALQRLAREGLVLILPRRGILVSEINVKNQLELLAVRRELERLMARLCAKRVSAPELAYFLQLADDMETAAERDDDVGFMRLDRRLNVLIAKGCRNEYALRSMGLMAGLSRRFWYRHYKEALDLPLCARLHAGLARAIGKGDAEAAAQASDRLLDYLETFTRATLEVGRTV